MSAASRKELPTDAGVVPQNDGEATNSEEELYKQTCAALAEHKAPGRKGGMALLLLATVVLFAAAAAWLIGFNPELEWWFIPLLIGVLLLHEAGHYLGMRLFGYRDLRMFFIPFFGAAVSGKKHAAPAWQQAIVLLLGPLPGMALGVLLWVFRPHGTAALAAYLLVLMNGFNLLPFAPLDGGKLLHVLLFARHPLSGSVFLFLSGIGLTLVAWINGSWVLGGLGLVLLIAAPVYYREWRQRMGVGRELPELPAELSDLGEDHRRALFRCARFLNPSSGDPDECANEMKKLHEQKVTKPAGVPATLGLLALYLVPTAAVMVTFHPSGLGRGIRNLRPVPMVGRIAGAFEMPANESLSIQKRDTTTKEIPREGYKFIGVTFEIDGERTLVAKDYVVLDASGSEYLPVGLSDKYGKCLHRDYAGRVDLQRNLNSPIAWGDGGIEALALSEPEITLLYEVPVRENRLQLRHRSIVHEFEVRGRLGKPDQRLGPTKR